MTSTRDWAAYALLLIDVQQDFWPTDIAADFPHFPNNISSLLETCRLEGLDVIHLQAKFKENRSDWMARYKLKNWIPCVEGSSGAKLLANAIPLANERVIEKQTFDGFLNPELEKHLRRTGKRYLLVAGLVTSVCVLLTGISAAQRGFLTAMVTDCCADEKSAHELTLNNYAFAFEFIESSDIGKNYERWQEEMKIVEASV